VSAWPAPPLEPDTERRLIEIGGADLVVGIPSFRNAATIAHVAGAAHAGLARHFPRRRAVLVDSDGGSEDGTREAFAAAPAPSVDGEEPVTRLVVRYRGPPGKGSAFRPILPVPARLRAPALPRDARQKDGFRRGG